MDQSQTTPVSQISFSFRRDDLQFEQPAGTSRGVLTSKPTWFLKIDAAESRGLGEVSLIPGLSLDNENRVEGELHKIKARLRENKAAAQLQGLIRGERHNQESINYPQRLLRIAHLLDSWKISTESTFPAIRFGMEMCLLELLSARTDTWFDTDFCAGKQKIPINGLIWMGDEIFMQEQIEVKLAEGFNCLKLKIGAIDFNQECTLLEHIRKNFTPQELELRVDANGAFSPAQAPQRLKTLSQFGLHSIEQPIRQGQWQEMSVLCKEPALDIALDEELIDVHGNIRKTMLETILPQYIILKPSLLGGFHKAGEWLNIAQELKIQGWVTSALESNLGLQAIAQWTSLYNFTMPQGLGTGKLFTNNLPSNLEIDQGFLTTNLSLRC
jgi:O-succinylbenzoate synthase